MLHISRWSPVLGGLLSSVYQHLTTLSFKAFHVFHLEQISVVLAVWQSRHRFKNTQFKRADMAISVMASRLMVANAASAFDANFPWVIPAAAMAKRFAADKCFHVCSDALQLLGEYGYLKDYSIERYVRDLEVHMILEGTNEIMRAIIVRHMNSGA